MWGQIILEASTQKNFNFGFSSFKSEITLHLSQWQYWWWFWFSFVWCLYFFILYKNNNEKLKNYNFILNTSMKGHGKWGDFLVSIIPLSWCANILINSNYILRMLEWQNETSFMTIRVQGKQWYWVYKYDSTLNNKIKNIYINIGNNNWKKLNKIKKNYYFTNSMIYDNEFLNRYFNNISKTSKNQKNLNLLNLCFNLDNWNLKNNIKKINNNLNTIKFSNINITKNNINFHKIFINKIHLNFFMLNYYYIMTKNIFNYNFNKIIKMFFFNNFNFNKYLNNNYSWVNNNFKFNIINNRINFKYDNIINETEETSNNIYYNNNKNMYLINKNNLLKQTNKQTNKQNQSEQFWGFRQKKVKKLKTFNFSKSINYLYNINNNLNIKNFNIENLNKYNNFILKRNNKHKNEIISVNLARRLLRTKRTLVLPVHLNLTVITNSYDVIHSWFIPGLGLKLDCVPGRSTHHSFYIENIGFYYGQCAEICGRYHHHMPIRVCALNFEQFLLWWQTKGIFRIIRENKLKKNILIKHI